MTTKRTALKRPLSEARIAHTLDIGATGPTWPKLGGAKSSSSDALLTGQCCASLPQRLGRATRGGVRIADP